MNWIPDWELSNNQMPIDNTCQHINAASLIDIFLHVLVIVSAIRFRNAWHIPTRRTKGKPNLSMLFNICQCYEAVRPITLRGF